MRRLLIAGAIPVAAALIAAGCGSSTSKSGYVATPQTTASQSTAATVAVALKKASFGQIIGGAKGKTLYLFLADKGGKSVCAAACAAAWPPLTGRVTAGSGVDAALLGTTTRTDGTKQVTYGGHPLYYYAPDKDSGDAYGEGLKQFGAEWYAVGANGKQVAKKGT